MSVDEIRAQIVAKLRSLPYRNPYDIVSRRYDPEIQRHNAELFRWQTEAADFNKAHPELRIAPDEIVCSESDDVRRTPIDALPPPPRGISV
jgi:hypothetical protein